MLSVVQERKKIGRELQPIPWSKYVQNANEPGSQTNTTGRLQPGEIFFITMSLLPTKNQEKYAQTVRRNK